MSEPTKLTWAVKGSIHYRDGGAENFTGTLPDRTLAEANEYVDSVVTNEFKSRKVRGVQVSAVAVWPGGRSVVARIEWK